MSHEIEQFENGAAAFVSARTDAWHRLGTVLESSFTAEQAMEHAHLGGWNVRKEPLQATLVTDDGVTTLDVPGKYATVRSNPITGTPDVLGVVGEWYTPIQNEAHTDVLNALVDESGAHFETAGSLRGGKQVFITMKLPNTMQIGGVDNVDLYIAGLNAHDGTAPFRLIVTPVRIVCANTQAAALRNMRAHYTIRHTSGSTNAISEARAALGLTFKYCEQFEAEAEKMIQATLRETDFSKTTRKLIPFKDERGERAKKQYEEKIVLLRDLFTGSETNTEIRGTRWAGYQAITEYIDHFAPVRATEGAELARAEKSLTKASVIDLKNRAFAAFAVAAK